MYLFLLSVLLSLGSRSTVLCQVNALASVLDFVDSNDYETDNPSVLEKPVESK